MNKNPYSKRRNVHGLIEQEKNKHEGNEIVLHSGKKRKFTESTSITSFEAVKETEITVENAGLKIEIMGLKERLSHYEHPNDEQPFSSVIAELRSQGKEIVDNLVSQLNEQREKLNNTQKRLERIEKVENQSIREVVGLKRQLKEQQQKNSDLEDNFNMVIHEDNVSDDEVEILREKLNMYNDNNDKLQEVKEANESLKSENQEIKDAINEIELVNVRLNVVVESKDDEIRRLTQKLNESKDLEEANEQLNDLNKKADRERESAKRDLNDLKESIRIENINRDEKERLFKEAIRKKDEKIQNFRKEASSGKKNELVKANREMTRELEKNKETIINLESQVNKNYNLMLKFQKEKEECFNKQSDELVVLEEESSSNHNLIIELKKKLIFHEEEVNKANHLSSLLTDEKERIKEQLEKEKLQKKELDDSKTQLENEKRELVKEINTLKSQQEVSTLKLQMEKNKNSDYERVEQELNERIEYLLDKQLGENTDIVLDGPQTAESDKLVQLLQEMTQDRNEAIKEQNEIKKQKETIEKEKKQLEEKFELVVFEAQQSSEIDNLNHLLNKIRAEQEKEKNDHEEELNLNKKQHEKLLSKVDDAFEQLSKKTTQYEIVIVERDSKQDDLDKMKKRLDEYNKNLKNQEDEVKRVNEEKERVIEEKKRSDKAHNDEIMLFQEKDDDLDKELNRLKDALNKAHEDLNKKEEEMEKINLRVNEGNKFKLALDEVVKEKNALDLKVISLSGDEDRKKRLHEEFKKLQEENEKNEKEKSEIKQGYELVVAENKQKDTAVEDLKRRLQDLNNEKDNIDENLQKAKKTINSYLTKMGEGVDEKKAILVQLKEEKENHHKEHLQLLESLKKYERERDVTVNSMDIIDPNISRLESEIVGLNHKLLLAHQRTLELEKTIEFEKSLAKKTDLSLTSNDLSQAYDIIRKQAMQLNSYLNTSIVDLDNNGNAIAYINNWPHTVLQFTQPMQNKTKVRWTFFNKFNDAQIYSVTEGGLENTFRNLSQISSKNDILIIDKASFEKNKKSKKITQVQTQPTILTIGSSSFYSSSLNDLTRLNKSFFTNLVERKKEAKGKYEIHLTFGDVFETKVRHVHAFNYQDTHFNVIDFVRLPQGHQEKVMTYYNTPNTIPYNGSIRIIITDKSSYETRVMETKYAIVSDDKKTIAQNNNVILFTHKLTPLIHRLDLIVIV